MAAVEFSIRRASGRGVYMYSNYSNISRNNIFNNYRGLLVDNSNSNTFYNNYIHDNSEGMRFSYSNNNMISNNIFYRNFEDYGITFMYSHNNTFVNNNISRNHFLIIYYSNNNKFNMFHF